MMTTLYFSDGLKISGVGYGAAVMHCGELVFNTAMTGYEEICTDPSYFNQVVLFSYPHIGNTGINFNDGQSKKPQLCGVVTRELPTQPSNWRSKISFNEYLQKNNIPGIAEIDSRSLVKKIRSGGTQSVCIDCRIDGDEASAKKALDRFASIHSSELASAVTCNEVSIAGNGGKKIALIDLGVKKNIIDCLVSRNCTVSIFPAHTSFEELVAYRPDGIVISNGPGDPGGCSFVFPLVKKITDASIPLFGICLGFQIIALALGGTTQKMKFGHHGSNHPVVNTQTGAVLITSQNHGYEVIKSTLAKYLKPTHISLFDSSLQGFTSTTPPILGFQGHPEAGPGPVDLFPLFDSFISLIEDAKKK